MNFEEAIKELEDINRRLGNETLTIEEAKSLFERGRFLSKFCYDNVKEIKGKILEIKQELDGLAEEDVNL